MPTMELTVSLITVNPSSLSAKWTHSIIHPARTIKTSIKQELIYILFKTFVKIQSTIALKYKIKMKTRKINR